MSFVEINWHPKRKQLQNFGKIALIATAIISLLLYVLKGMAIQWALIIFAIGLIIFLSSIISLRLTRAIYVCLTAVTFPIGLVVSFTLLTAFYFLLLAPLGLLFRLTGRDVLGRKFDSTAESYWQQRKPPESSEYYFHQF
ncbi:MAG: SxtJ family membrane protein [Phycisphaerae bacterium]